MNVFVTVGTQLPFDRLVRAVDEWAATRPAADVFAQIGPSRFRPRHCHWKSFIDAQECEQRMSAADLVVAHAGMGSIITALELGKPIIIMPRRAALGEHRSDHQMATVRRLADRAQLQIVVEEQGLTQQLDERLATISSGRAISRLQPQQLIGRIRSFIREEALAVPASQPLGIDLPGAPAVQEAALSALSHS